MLDKTLTVRDHRQVFWDPGGDYCMQLQKNIHASIPRKALPMVLAGPWGEAQPRQEGAVWKSPEVWEKMERHYYYYYFSKDLKRNKSLTKPETTECKNIVDAAPAQLAAPRAWCCCLLQWCERFSAWGHNAAPGGTRQLSDPICPKLGTSYC